MLTSQPSTCDEDHGEVKKREAQNQAFVSDDCTCDFQSVPNLIVDSISNPGKVR